MAYRPTIAIRTAVAFRCHRACAQFDNAAGFLTFNDARGSGTRHFVADSHILAWLEDKCFAYDIVTDEDLDNEGEDCWRRIRGADWSHPEYHTLRTLDALQDIRMAVGGWPILAATVSTGGSHGRIRCRM